MTNPDAIKPSTSTVLLIICLFLVGLDAALIIQNRLLNQRISRLVSLERKPMEPGSPVPMFSMLDTDRSPIPLDFSAGAGETLLLISSASCAYCDEAKQEWEQITAECATFNVRIIGIELGSSPSQIESQHEPYPVFVPGGDAGHFVDQIPGVPAAIFVDDTGRVIRAFYGEQAGLREAVASHYRMPTDQSDL